MSGTLSIVGEVIIIIIIIIIIICKLNLSSWVLKIAQSQRHLRSINEKFIFLEEDFAERVNQSFR
jgi:hypothetical protein